MGWTDGDIIARDITAAVRENVADPIARQRILSAMVRALDRNDADLGYLDGFDPDLDVVLRATFPGYESTSMAEQERADVRYRKETSEFWEPCKGWVKRKRSVRYQVDHGEGGG